jgi:antitoxin HicB
MAERRTVELYFEPQPEGGFTVFSPELPGLVTQGDSFEDATAMAEEALALYLEDLDKATLPNLIRRTFRLPG